MASDYWDISQCAREVSKLHDELWQEKISAACAIKTASAMKTASATKTNFIKQHCEIVARISIFIAKESGVELSPADRDLLICGALAHDIGTYSVLNEENLMAGIEPIFQREIYIQHGTRGYKLLLEKGFDEQLAQFARNHTGVGITRADVERQHLALPPDDYLAQNRLQEIVMLADKFHTKSLPPKFVSVETARARCAKFGGENLARWDKLVAELVPPSRDELNHLAQEYSMEMM